MEKLIGEVVNDDAVSADEFPPEAISGRLRAISGACSALKDKWVHELFSAVKEHVLSRYVQYHQAGITSLSDTMSLKIPNAYFEGIGDKVHHFYYAIVADLEDLLQFLKLGFYKYFDIDHRVSSELCRVQAEQILLLLEETKAVFSRTNIDRVLAEAIALSVKNKITDAKQSGISYRELDYCRAMLTTIREKLKESPSLETDGFAQELYRQNFNSHQFNQWYQHHLSVIINAASENRREKIILQEIRLLKLIFVEKDKIFEPDLPPVNEQVLSWLEQFLPVQNTSNTNDNLKYNGHHRMPLQFSVTQFALFVRLCYLEGCFHINNISDIFRFFTQHFESKKQLNISFKSFARAFYGVDQATAAVVRDFLQRMINTINKIYFP
ncbi:MAG TPA: hypothetical protein VHA56_07905 [Mucilaginibacter sp.]|nr:hypothetical protein [Mucilaginibacter sp.]